MSWGHWKGTASLFQSKRRDRLCKDDDSEVGGTYAGLWEHQEVRTHPSEVLRGSWVEEETLEAIQRVLKCAAGQALAQPSGCRVPSVLAG